MKKLVSIVTLLAFLVSAMPAVTHAMTHSVASKVEAQHDHHAATKTTDKAAKSHCDKQANKQTNKTPCCEKDACECNTNACNGGLSKIIGNQGNYLLSRSVSESGFTLSEDYIASAASEGLKRPPRA